MTRGFWHDRGALRGDVLVALARDLGPRRLGARRRRRLLVHPRPLRRHAQGRRQARRAGRGRERRGRPPGRPRGGGHRRPARDQGRGDRRARASCGPARRTMPDLRGAIAATRRRPSSASRSSRRSSRSSGAAQDPLRQGHAPGRSGRPGSAWTRATCRRSTIRDVDRDPARSAAGSGSMPTRDQRPPPRARRRQLGGPRPAGRRPRRAARRPAFDVMLAITRGGLVPAGMLAYRLRIRTSWSRRSSSTTTTASPGPRPTFLQFPADPLLRGQRVLIVDEVWDSGTTIHAVTERVRQAGGIPTPPSSTGSRSARSCPAQPDVHAVDHRRVGRLPVQGRRLTGTVRAAEEVLAKRHDRWRTLRSWSEPRRAPSSSRATRRAATGRCAARCARAGRSTT